MIEKAQQFLAKYSITAHTITVLVANLVLFYNFNTQFHDTVLGAYGHFPAWLKTGVELSIAFYMWYKTNHKPAA